MLTDFESYPEWNPFIVRLDGSADPGETLVVRMQAPEGRGMTFKPVVIIATPDSVFEWLGHVMVPGIFDGRHRFDLAEVAGGTRFTQSEEFRGFLVPILWRWLDQSTRHGFELMNQALKKRVESISIDERQP